MSEDTKPDAMPPEDAGEAAPPPSPPPPRGPSAKLLLLFAGVVAASLFVGASFHEGLQRGGAMLIAALGGSEDGQGHDGEDAGVKFYSCGMHPWVILPKPGDCPVCHMKLTPLDPSKFTGEIVIDPVVVQNIGVRVAPVTTGPLERTIRTVGFVDYDETTVKDVNMKVSGWIEKLHADYLGMPVKKGQELFELYSPDLYAAQEEYLLAWRNRDKVGAPFVPEAAKGAADLVEAARTRLEYLDVTPAQIEALEQADRPNKTMTILSPHRGIVVAKHANEGMRVDPGMQVYRIADLSRVWVMVTLYEYQLPYVSLGQRAVMTLPYIPGQSFEGRVIYIYPFLERQTRQVKVRLEFDNPNLLLKPSMYAGVELHSRLAENRTLVPRSAVMDTGERQVAFVSLGEGKFDPRAVKLGVEGGDGNVEVREGLAPGEMVVVSGQFLIDSEANIREALAMMIRGDLASEQVATAAVSGASELSSLPVGAETSLEGALRAYFRIGDALASDGLAGVEGAARDLAGGLDALLAVALPDAPHFWHKHPEAAAARGKALEMVGEPDLAEARLIFADLSVAMGKLAHATGVPPSMGTEVQELHCPMFREGQGGTSWLQPAGEVRNPYMGCASAMLDCFDKRVALPVTGP